jgi:hypothetical protein
MSYPYSIFYLEAQWSKVRVAERFDFWTGALVRNWVVEGLRPAV